MTKSRTDKTKSYKIKNNKKRIDNTLYFNASNIILRDIMAAFDNPAISDMITTNTNTNTNLTGTGTGTGTNTNTNAKFMTRTNTNTNLGTYISNKECFDDALCLYKVFTIINNNIKS